MASTFKFTPENFKRIVLAGRRGFTKQMAQLGRTVLVTIQGNGNTVDVKNKAGELVASATGTGEALQKRIYNTFANSEVAMTNPQNIAKYAEAKKEFKAGNTDKAHELFSELANSFQVSFNVLYGGKGDDLINKLGDQAEISGKLQLIETANGSIITIDPKTIRVMEPEVVGSMELPSAYGDDEDEVEEDEDVSTSAEVLGDAFATMDRPALVIEAKKIGFKTKDKSDDEIRIALRAAAVTEDEEA